MKRRTAIVALLVALTAATSALAEEGRFDAQVFRPLAAPRDLVMVPKSEVIGHLCASSEGWRVQWDKTHRGNIQKPRSLRSREERNQ